LDNEHDSVSRRGGGISVWLDTLNTADRVNLLELYARSVMLIELGRATDWVDLFDPYAVVRCAGGSRPFKGRAELLELAHRMISGEFDLATGVMTPGSHCRHTLTDVSLFSGGADGGATGYAHLTVSAAAANAAPRWLASGVYADRLHKCGAGCWRFHSRILTVDGVSASLTVRAPEREAAVDSRV
jgi:SnoaL-like domain